MVRQLEGTLWESRVKGKDGIARGIYLMLTGRRLIVLQVFQKTSRKTPRRTIETARQRLKQEIL